MEVKVKNIPNNTKLLIILGPTAVGKSDLAVKLAKKFNGEIISADSRQIYKGLDIATGKISKSEMQGIPHHLLSVVSPKKQFTASDYIIAARESVRCIEQKKKLPIICGGSGFYISALLGDINLSDVPPNMALRKKLKIKSIAELFQILKKHDPKKAETVDAKNPARLIRAIEIATGKNTPPHRVAKILCGGEYDVLKIGLNLPKEELEKNIKLRVASRMKKGMLREAQNLHKNGLSFKRMRELGLEYRALADFLEKKITKEELVERIEKENWQYAKRQMTWFKRDPKIKWFKPNSKKDLKSLQTAVQKFV